MFLLAKASPRSNSCVGSCYQEEYERILEVEGILVEDLVVDLVVKYMGTKLGKCSISKF